MGKKMFSVLLSLAMVFTMIPMATGAAFAAEGDDEVIEKTISEVIAQEYWGTVGETTKITVDANQEYNYRYKDGENGDRVDLKGDVILYLMDNCSLEVPGGIYVPNGASLTINSQSPGKDMGKLRAGSNIIRNRAAIGGNANSDGIGNITINGGNITATGGSNYGAAIGGGDQIDKSTSDNATIEINGGNITAYGGKDAAGIGAGRNTGNDFKISVKINGGKIYATSQSNGRAIGYGDNDSTGVTVEYGRDFAPSLLMKNNKGDLYQQFDLDTPLKDYKKYVKVGKPIAETTEDNVQYHSVQEALNEVHANHTVKLLSDVKENIALIQEENDFTVTDSSKITLDLNGHTLDAEEPYETIYIDGTSEEEHHSLVIQNSSENASYIKNTATSETAPAAYGGAILAKGNLTIDGSDGPIAISDAYAGRAGAIYTRGIVTVKGDVTIENCHAVYQENGIEVKTGYNKNEKLLCTDTGRGGAVYIASNEVEVDWDTAGQFYLSGGVVKDCTVLNADSPQSNLCGGAFFVSGEGKLNMYSPAEIRNCYVDNEDFGYGDDIYLSTKGRFTMTGGVIYNSAEKLKNTQIFGYKLKHVGEEQLSEIDISYGWLSEKIEKTDAADNWVTAKYCIKKDSMYYYCNEADFSDLIDPDSGEPQIIEIGEDIVLTEPITVPAEVDLTLDLNGHTITGPNGKQDDAIVNSGNLTIKDGSTEKTGKVIGNVSNNGGTITISGGTYTNKVEANIPAGYEWKQLPDGTYQLVVSSGKDKAKAVGSGVALIKAKATGNKTIKLSWKAVPAATKYVIYGNKCGKKYKKLKTTTGRKYTVKKIKGKKLKAHKVYKFYVVAYTPNGKAKSKSIRCITGKTKGKYANAKSIKVNKKTVTLKAGNSVKLKAKTRVYKGKKHLKKKFGAATRYISDNPSVATVTKKGLVKGISAGTAIIYVQDIGGLYCKTKITVK